MKKHKLTQGSSNSKHLNDYASDKYSLIDDIDSVISITKYLIENQDAIFFIDSELHNELIQTIDNVSESDVNSILMRKIHQSIGITLMKNTSTTSSLLNTPILSSDGSDESSSYAKLNFNSNNNNVNSTLTKQSSKNTLNSKTKLYTNVDFIDSNREKRTSRTKLHKITSNFNSSSNLLQPIHFVNSPSHSPISSSSNGSSNQQQSNKQLNETVTRKFSNDLYDEPDLNSLHPIFCNQASSSSSSLLLMIPTQANKNNA